MEETVDSPKKKKETVNPGINTKKPLTRAQYNDILLAAQHLDRKKEKGQRYNTPSGSTIGEHEAVILTLRWTGMHISVLAEPEKYQLRVEDDEIRWNRTKKKEREAYTSIPISKNITFNLNEFIWELKRRERKRSRQYFYDLIKRVGKEAKQPKISQMSFRHTLAVDLLDAGCSDQFVQQTLNCSAEVLKTYGKYSKERKKSVFERIDW